MNAVEQVAEVRAIGDWRDNGEMIADVARLGYLDGTVLDATYGRGGFWTSWRPEALTTNDLRTEAEYCEDYRALPWPDGSFNAVVFDPDYKLNGTPALDDFDDRYGVDIPKNREERLDDIAAGTVECYRVARRWLLVKCMDQVEGGKVRWQSDLVARTVEELGGRKADAFLFVPRGQRPQPGCRTCHGTGIDPEWHCGCGRGVRHVVDCGTRATPDRAPCPTCGGSGRRKQRTALRNYSSLLVFARGRSVPAPGMTLL